MANGNLIIHVMDKIGMPMSGARVAAKKGAVIKSCTADAGACIFSLPYGTWMIVARSLDGCFISTALVVTIASASVSKTVQVKNPTECYDVECPPCPACPPCSTAAEIAPAAMSKSSTKPTRLGTLQIGSTGGTEMATTNCRWFPVAVDKVPSYFIAGGNALNFSVLTKAADLAEGVLSTGDFAMIGKTFVNDVVAQGEDAADAEAILAAATVWVGQYNGSVYAFIDSQAGVYVYLRKCGAMAQLPYIIGGAALLGTIGFAYGYSKKGGKGRKSGIPAYALMAATIGVLGGAGGGYLLSKLATDSFTKSADKMGALRVNRRRVVRRCPQGMVWNNAGQQCIQAR